MKDKKAKTKFWAIFAGLYLCGLIIFFVISFIEMKKLEHVEIGKMIDLHLENANAAYLEHFLEDEINGLEEGPNAKFTLLKKEVLAELIEYMKENNLKITDGNYEVPQTSSFEEIINIFQFEEEK